MDAPQVEIYGGGEGVTGDHDAPLRILVVQTAFPGDVVLTLPLIQLIKKHFPAAHTDLLVIPAAANIAEHHPAVHAIVRYDKKGTDAGFGGFIRMLRQIRTSRYAIAVVPHRSFRSALLVFLAGIRVRIGFDRSAGFFLLNRLVRYDKTIHESGRNCRLINELDVQVEGKNDAHLYPGVEESRRVDLFLREAGIKPEAAIIAIAPGSVWATKRWPDYYFGEVVRDLRKEGYQVVLVGGAEDAPLCEQIARMGGGAGIASAAGRFNFLESAELIRRSRILLTNDSAPLHLANAVGTPVAAIFGPTVPRFGFGPTGAHDRVLEIDGLDCRPCGIHGGTVCPIGTFPCMLTLRPGTVVEAVRSMLSVKKE